MDENPYKGPRNFRFSLRTLMIAATVGPPILAGGYLFPRAEWPFVVIILMPLLIPAAFLASFHFSQFISDSPSAILVFAGAFALMGAVLFLLLGILIIAVA